jgi:apolipoprotein D and lipocalin family protein
MRSYAGGIAIVRLTVLVLIPFLLAGCLGMPKSVTPVNGFDSSRYLGTWYEVARLDHSFERGLDRVTAEYSSKEGGGIRVVNRGYSVSQGSWKEAEGVAYFVENPDIGYLKVSFFGPFYGSYVVFELDRNDYSYAYVSGPDTSYLWLLSRTPRISEERRDHFIDQARARGFETDSLIWVKH